MTKTESPAKAQIIAPDAYPQMMSKPRRGPRHAGLALRPRPRPRRKWRWKPPCRPCAPPSCNMSTSWKQAAGDMRQLFDKAHEIRGFAETAGLITTGRIAEILCRYMDDMTRIGQAAGRHHRGAACLGHRPRRPRRG